MAVIIIDDQKEVKKGSKQTLTIYELGQDILLLKRSVMKENQIWTTIITAVASVLTVLIGKVGVERFKAWLEYRLKSNQAESDNIKFIITTLRTFKEEATLELATYRKENTDLIIKNAALGSENNALKAEKATLEATNKALSIEIEKLKKTKT